MKNKKTIFNSDDFKTFLEDSSLILDSTSMNRIKGGDYIQNTYKNYAESTGVYKKGIQ